ncbi:MAG: heavy-metal-associated domain-containing protein [Flavobacteriales bacterium]
MKNLLKTGAFLLLLVAGQTQAQDADHSKLTSVDIHTNAVCDMCQTTIQTEMLYVKGVQAVNVDLEANIIHVDYKANKTDPDKLREAVAKLGYMADNLMPDPEARKALPDCCQKEGCGMPGMHKEEAAPVTAPAPTTAAPEESLAPTAPAAPAEPVEPQP